MKVLLIFLMIVLSACNPASNNTNFNNSEPTLQSAEDANTTQFTEESFR